MPQKSAALKAREKTASSGFAEVTSPGDKTTPVSKPIQLARKKSFERKQRKQRKSNEACRGSDAYPVSVERSPAASPATAASPDTVMAVPEPAPAAALAPSPAPELRGGDAHGSAQAVVASSEPAAVVETPAAATRVVGMAPHWRMAAAAVLVAGLAIGAVAVVRARRR
jgi:hypothetical protein